MPQTSSELPPQIALDQLTIEFNDMFYDYYVKPPDPSKSNYYITEMSGVKMGFGSKIQLRRALDLIAKDNPSGYIPISSILIKPIPELKEPIVRRLGTKEIKVVEPEPSKARLKDNQLMSAEQRDMNMSETENQTRIVNNPPEGPRW